jgi:quercetin dioxygenase-like cupin family protein
MKRQKTALVTVVAATALTGAAATATPAAAQRIDGANGSFDLDPISQGVLQHPERTVVIAELTLGPGDYIDWHRHPGAVYGVIDGSPLTVVDRGCREHTYQPGEAFTPPKQVHTARNHGSATTVITATFVVRGPAPTVFEPAAVDEQLDAKCDFIGD